MTVIFCAKYKKNPSRTVDATERTQFFKSRPYDLEDIGQGRRSSHATHPLMLLIICTKYGKNPSWTIDATGRTRKVNGQTDRRTDGRTDGQMDGRTDRQTDRQTGWIQYTPPNSVAGGINMTIKDKNIFLCLDYHKLYVAEINQIRYDLILKFLTALNFHTLSHSVSIIFQLLPSSFV